MKNTIFTIAFFLSFWGVISILHSTFFANKSERAAVLKKYGELKEKNLKKAVFYALNSHIINPIKTPVLCFSISYILFNIL